MHLQIINFKAYWDCDNHFGKIDLFFPNNGHWQSPNLANSDFVAMISLLQFPNILWHPPSNSIVKG
jgi:hypothetical protein